MQGLTREIRENKTTAKITTYIVIPHMKAILVLLLCAELARPAFGQVVHKQLRNVLNPLKTSPKYTLAGVVLDSLQATVEPHYNDIGTMNITLFIYQASRYIRVKKKNIKNWDQQDHLVLKGFCYFRALYNDVPL